FVCIYIFNIIIFFFSFLFFFFFYSSGNPRDLHSFPTRRSSDLGTGGPVLMLPLLMLLGVPLRGAIVLAQGVQLPVAVAASGVHRSEEHTSELQSLAYLVCRLLLEKKKKKYTKIIKNQTIKNL